MKYSFGNYEINNIRKMDEQFISNLISNDSYFNYSLLYECKFDNYDDLVKSNYMYTIKEMSNNQVVGMFTYTDKKFLYIIINKRNEKIFSNVIFNILYFIINKLNENNIYILNNSKNTFLNNILTKTKFKFDSRKSLMVDYTIKEYTFYYLTSQMFNKKKFYPVIYFKEDLTLNHLDIKAYIDNNCIGYLKSTISNNDITIKDISCTEVDYDKLIKDKLLKKCYQIISEYNYYCLHFNNYYILSYTSNDIKDIILSLNTLFCENYDNKLIFNNILNNKYLFTFIEVLSVNKIEYNLLNEYNIIKRKNEYSTLIVTSLSKDSTRLEYFIQDNYLVIKPIELLNNEILGYIKYLEEKTSCLYSIIYTYTNKTNLNYKYKNQVLL